MIKQRTRHTLILCTLSQLLLPKAQNANHFILLLIRNVNRPSIFLIFDELDFFGRSDAINCFILRLSSSCRFTQQSNLYLAIKSLFSDKIKPFHLPLLQHMICGGNILQHPSYLTPIKRQCGDVSRVTSLLIPSPRCCGERDGESLKGVHAVRDTGDQ